MLFSSRPFLLFYVTSPVWGAVTPNLSWIGVSPVPSYYRHFSLSLVSQTSETKQNKNDKPNDKPNDNSKPQEFSSPSSEATSALLPLSAKLLSHGYQCPHFHPHNKTSWFGALSPKVKFIIVLYIPPTCSLKIIYMTFQTILCLEQHFVMGDFSTCGVLLGLRNFDFEAFLALTVQTGDVRPVPPGCTELCKRNDIIHILHFTLGTENANRYQQSFATITVLINHIGQGPVSLRSTACQFRSFSTSDFWPLSVSGP